MGRRAKKAPVSLSSGVIGACFRRPFMYYFYYEQTDNKLLWIESLDVYASPGIIYINTVDIRYYTISLIQHNAFLSSRMNQSIDQTPLLFNRHAPFENDNVIYVTLQLRNNRTNATTNTTKTNQILLIKFCKNERIN